MKVYIFKSDHWYKAGESYVCQPILKWGCYIVNTMEFTLIDQRHAKIVK